MCHCLWPSVQFVLERIRSASREPRPEHRYLNFEFLAALGLRAFPRIPSHSLHSCSRPLSALASPLCATQSPLILAPLPVFSFPRPLPAPPNPSPKPPPSATSAWPGSAKPASACLSTGAFTPPSPANGTANPSPAPANGSWRQATSRLPGTKNWCPQFNPVKFNARDWVRMAKGAGMKYIVITSKHHEGFGLLGFQTDRLVHQIHAVQARPPQRTGRGLQKRRHHALLLPFHHGLAPSGLQPAPRLE